MHNLWTKIGKLFNSRRKLLIFGLLCILALSLSLWSLSGTRTKYEFREVSRFVLSTNIYKDFRNNFKQTLTDASRNVLSVHGCLTNNTSFHNLLKSNPSRVSSLYDKYWDDYIYDLDNDRVFSVSGHFLHYDVNSGNNLSVRKIHFPPRSGPLIYKVNNFLNNRKIFGKRYQIPVKNVEDITQPVYFGHADGRVRIEGDVVYSWSKQVKGSPDGRFVILPQIQDDKGRRIGPWIVNMSDGKATSLIEILESIPDIPFENLAAGSGMLWVDEKELIVPLHALRDNGSVASEGEYLILVDLEKSACKLLLSPERRLEFIRQLGWLNPETGPEMTRKYGIIENHIGRFRGEKRKGDTIVTLLASRGFDSKPVHIEINATTMESDIFQKNEGNVIWPCPIHFEGNIVIEQVWQESKNKFIGYIIRDKDSQKVLWSLNHTTSSGRSIRIGISSGHLIIMFNSSVWRCELDGSNPVPLIPFDCPMSYWNEIVSPMKEDEFNQDHF